MIQAVKNLKALSDPTRLRILQLLLRKELCVCELVFTLKMEQSRISHQLRILKEAGLVEDIREGKWINYRIKHSSRDLLAFLFDRFFKADLEKSTEAKQDRINLKNCLKREIRKKKGIS